MVKNTAKFALSFSRNFIFLMGCFYAAPCIQTNGWMSILRQPTSPAVGIMHELQSLFHLSPMHLGQLTSIIFSTLCPKNAPPSCDDTFVKS